MEKRMKTTLFLGGSIGLVQRQTERNMQNEMETGVI